MTGAGEAGEAGEAGRPVKQRPGLPACRTHLRQSSSCAYRNLSRDRRATISAWQSFRASPRSLMYSPLMHLVPVETLITLASLTSVPEKQDTPFPYVTVTVVRLSAPPGLLCTPVAGPCGRPS